MANIAITGAGRGIGLELTRQHLAAGDRVFALVRDPGSLETLAAGSGGKLTVHKMDVSDGESITSGAASTGGAPIDILYNVAGVSGVSGVELESTDWDAFDQTVNVNVKGPMRVLQAFLPQLGKGSRVINFSSQLGASTWPYGGHYAYAATKAALGRLMRSVAIDLKDRGIVIGIVHPGWVQTDMGGPGAEITPEQSASGIRKLAENWMLEQSGDFFNWDGRPHAW